MARNSEIIIAQNIKLDNTYKNVLSYNQTQMLNLVNTNKVASANNYSFIRQEQNMVQVNFAYSTICNANYMAFQNKDYNNKWFFAFIRDIQYVSDSCVNIVFDIDVWSTFYSNLTIHKCFVEREHVNDDTIGLHTVPEDISTGEMIQIGDDVTETELSTSFYVGVLTDWIPEGGGKGKGKQNSGVTVYNNGVFGHQLILFKLQLGTSGSTTPDIENLKWYLDITNFDGHIEDVKDIFIIPSGLINETTLTLAGAVRTETTPPTFNGATYFYTVPDSYTEQQLPIEIDKVTSFSDITVVNNKCYVYPYNYLLVTNNQGNQNIYKYEDFNDADEPTKAKFMIQLALQIGISGRCLPLEYKGQQYNDDEALPLGKYPTCNWTADSFTNWLTQQSVNLPTKTLGLGIGMFAGALTYGTAGAGLIGVSSIINSIGAFKENALKSNIEGGGNTGDVIYSAQRNNFYFKCMRCKPEYMSIVDSYFTRFGYKINETKIPNLTGRTNFNYIKIGGNDVFATGNIQTKFLETINKIAQQGVTIWHNHANIGDFSVTNTIVTTNTTTTTTTS